MNDEKNRMTGRVRVLLLAMAFVLLFSILGGTTAAFLSRGSQKVRNTFRAPVTKGALIDELSASGDAKTKIAVKNESDYPVYVRLAVIGNTLDGQEGNVTGNYDVDPYLSGSGFTNIGGFWYYNAPLAAGSTTGNLISTAIPLYDSASGQYYRVTVLSETIQAVGKTESGAPAVTDAWGVSIDANGYITGSSSGGSGT